MPKSVVLRDGQSVVATTIAIPRSALIVDSGAQRSSAGRHRDRRLPRAIRLLGHRRIRHTIPAIIAPMQRHACRASSERAVIGDGRRLTVYGATRRGNRAPSRAGITSDGDGIVAATIVIPGSRAVAENHVDLGGIVGNADRCLPEIISPFDHRGVGRGNVLPVILTPMQVDLALIIKRAMIVDRQRLTRASLRRVRIDGVASVRLIGVRHVARRHDRCRVRDGVGIGREEQRD